MLDLATMNIGAALPAIALAIGACVLFIVDLSIPQDKKERTLLLALVGISVSFVMCLFQINDRQTAFEGMYIGDSFTALVNMVALVGAFVGLLVAHDYLKRTNMQRGEYYPLLLLTTAGAMFMGAAGDLITLVIALELLSIPLYVMSGFRRPDVRSEESAMKYFLLGAFSSGFLIYGIALTYGATGTTNLTAIFARIQSGEFQSVFLLLMGTG